MSVIDESNVDHFKTEHECDEHWELRRKFLLTHASKFTMDELQCLAQVFTNVEFLGCKYPKETMQMIAELSKDVVQDYREKQKTRLQRTFVKASDAASSKVKGQTKPETSTNSFDPGESSQKTPSLSTSFKRAHELNTQGNYPDAKRKRPNPSRNVDIVLFEYLNDTPQSMISRAATSYGIELDWKFDQVGFSKKCSIIFNKKKIGEAIGATQKAAKKDASKIALQEMRKHYYTIRVTKNLTPNFVDDKGMRQETKSDTNTLGNDNIGSKMMKLMGWSGGGLGKSSQGITEPVNVQQQLTREGLGLKTGSYNMNAFKKRCSEVLQDYIRGDTSIDLVFSPCFSNEERAMIHQIAKRFGLKSQSYGPRDQRTLSISRKVHPRELVNELLALGGVTEKYQLIEPTED